MGLIKMNINCNYTMLMIVAFATMNLSANISRVAPLRGQIQAVMLVDYQSKQYAVRLKNLSDDRSFYFFNFLAHNLASVEGFTIFITHDLVAQGCGHSVKELITFCYSDRSDAEVFAIRMLASIKDCHIQKEELQCFYDRVVKAFAHNPEKLAQALVKVAQQDYCFINKCRCTFQ